MSFNRLRFWIVFGLVVLLALATVAFVGPGIERRVRGHRLAGAHHAVSVGTTTVWAVIVNDETGRQRGLSGTDGLASDEGMLFVYDKEGAYRFWMKDMRYALDIIWLDASGTIVGLWESVQPASYPRTWAPRKPARYVLEVSAGFAKAHGLKIGDTVSF